MASCNVASLLVAAKCACLPTSLLRYALTKTWSELFATAPSSRSVSCCASSGALELAKLSALYNVSNYDTSVYSEQQLVTQAVAFSACSPRQIQLCRIVLLCEIVNSTTPTFTPSGLLGLASGYLGDQGQLDLIEIGLLLQLSGYAGDLGDLIGCASCVDEKSRLAMEVEFINNIALNNVIIGSRIVDDLGQFEVDDSGNFIITG